MAVSAASVIDTDERSDLNESVQRASDASKTPRSGGGNGPLERVTVTLIARAARALQAVAELTGDSKTDSINRAIQIYAYLEDISSRGGAIYVRESADSELERLKMF
jgi:hypothetical protein